MHIHRLIHINASIPPQRREIGCICRYRSHCHKLYHAFITFDCDNDVLCSQPAKMRIQFGRNLNPLTTYDRTGFPRLQRGRNPTINGADSAVRKITLKSPNTPPDQALLKGLSLQKERETHQLIEYSLFLFYLSHFPEGCVP